MELRGNLREFVLSDIVQLLESSRKTGVLRIQDSGAALYFEQGRVVHAECCGFEGEEAVYLLFQAAQGEFSFQRETLPGTRTITSGTTHLLLEAARRLDESRRREEPEWRPWLLEDENKWFGIRG